MCVDAIVYWMVNVMMPSRIAAAPPAGRLLFVLPLVKSTPCQMNGMRKSRKTISVRTVVYTTASTGMDAPRNAREA